MNMPWVLTSSGPLDRFVEAISRGLGSWTRSSWGGDRLDRRTLVNDRLAVMHDHATAWRDPVVVLFETFSRWRDMSRRHAIGMP